VEEGKQNKALASLREDVESRLDDGIRAFFARARLQVEPFIEQHFCYPGCWATNKRAFGYDLLRVPINVLWAPFYILLLLVLSLLAMGGVSKARAWALRLPGGFTTEVQKNINACVQRQLLDSAGLSEAIVLQLNELVSTEDHCASRVKAIGEQLEEMTPRVMSELMLTRTATADISNSIFSTLVGALMFKKFTPGGIGLGVILASLWVNYRAKQNFFLGETLGDWYYAVFPQAATFVEQGIGVMLVMLLLAVVASFSGLITDPFQAKVGMHRRRLLALIDQTERDMLEGKQSRFKTLDPYVARIVEVMDAVKSQWPM